MKRPTNAQLIEHLNKLRVEISSLGKDNDYLREQLKQAKGEAQWKGAMVQELLEILKNGTHEGKFPRQ